VEVNDPEGLVLLAGTPLIALALIRLRRMWSAQRTEPGARRAYPALPAHILAFCSIYIAGLADWLSNHTNGAPSVVLGWIAIAFTGLILVFLLLGFTLAARGWPPVLYPHSLRTHANGSTVPPLLAPELSWRAFVIAVGVLIGLVGLYIWLRLPPSLLGLLVAPALAALFVLMPRRAP
jgi:hypothetical protein